MKRLFYIAPVLIFGLLAYVLFDSLYAPPHDQLPSALLGKPAPKFSLPALDQNSIAFTRKDLAAGHVTVLNVWASWCVPCRLEAPMLSRVTQLQGVALYGLVYKDNASKARQFLRETGNPFARLDIDSRGHAAIDWGVYDVPETFVIDGKGIVRLRFSGPITEEVFGDILLPAVEDAKRQTNPAKQKIGSYSNKLGACSAHLAPKRLPASAIGGLAGGGDGREVFHEPGALSSRQRFK